jgi:hypothetical protein
MSEQTDADQVPKPEKKEAEIPKETPAEKPMESKKEEGSLILNEIEKDLIADLKKRVNLEEFADFDQKTRIKIMRQIKKSLPADVKKEEKKVETPVDPNKVKGDVKDPTTPPKPTEPKKILTNLEKNNMKEFLNDVRKKSSVHNITSQIRGK